MKVLILVLSAMREPWGAMLNTALETWDSEPHSQTETLYYCGKSSEQSKPGLFYSPNFDEELERISARTMEAFEHSLTLEWDLMARVHSSCYVHKQNLVNYCETQPTEGVMQGLMTGGPTPFLWGGGHYLFSRDVIKKFVENPDKWTPLVMEDVAMTNAAFALGIPITSGRSATICLVDWTIEGKKLCLCYNAAESFEFTDWADIRKAHPSFYFRCKQDLKRHLDLEIFHKLHEHYV
jgi:hypothetical protein